MFVSGSGCVFAQSQHHSWAFMLIKTLARLCLLQSDPCSQPRIMSISVIFIYQKTNKQAKKHHLQSKHPLKPQTRPTDPHYKLRYSFMMKIILTCLVEIVIGAYVFIQDQRHFIHMGAHFKQITFIKAFR